MLAHLLTFISIHFLLLANINNTHTYSWRVAMSPIHDGEFIYCDTLAGTLIEAANICFFRQRLNVIRYCHNTLAAYLTKL